MTRPLTVVTTTHEAEIVAEDVARRLGHRRLSDFEPIRYGKKAQCRDCGKMILIEHIRGVWLLSGSASTERCGRRQEVVPDES